MKLHELKIKHKYLVDIARGVKTFELRKNDRDYQVGDLIHFIDIDLEQKEVIIVPTRNNEKVEYCDWNIDHDALYKIIYILKDVPEYGLDKDYCILGIKKLEVK